MIPLCQHNLGQDRIYCANRLFITRSALVLRGDAVDFSLQALMQRRQYES